MKHCLFNQGRNLHAGDYDRQLRRIGSEDCPKDFRLAWLDYQSAWTQHCAQERQKSNREFLDFVGTGAAAIASHGLTLLEASSGASALAADAKQAVTDTRPAWSAVKKQCLIFNTPLGAEVVDF